MLVTAGGRAGGSVKHQVRGHNDNIGNCPLNCPWSCYWYPSWGWQLLRTGAVQGKGSNTDQRESKSELWLRGRSVSHKICVQGTLMWRREMEQQPAVTKGKPIPPCWFVNRYEPFFYLQVTSAHVFILSHAWTFHVLPSKVHLTLHTKASTLLHHKLTTHLVWAYVKFHIGRFCGG